MIIDTPVLGDIPALKQLWKQAFGDPDDFIDSFFATGFSVQRCRCVYEAGAPVAVLYWFDCAWQHKKLAYLYAIATHKDFRGRGLCQALMADTHKALTDLGYAGAVLVPADKGLFSLYEKLGYYPFCPMQKQQIFANRATENICAISGEEYFQSRLTAAPENAVLFQPEVYPFLGSYNRFYRSGDCLFCAAFEEETLYFQEYLGDAAKLPGILHTLGAKQAVVPLPGGTPFAMYRSFCDESGTPAYFNIALD